MSTEQWLALAEKCEQATGPDRGIDCLIENYSGTARFEAPHYFRAHIDGDKRLEPHPYTTSIDTITALIGDKLPKDWQWLAGHCGDSFPALFSGIIYLTPEIR